MVRGDVRGLKIESYEKAPPPLSLELDLLSAKAKTSLDQVEALLEEDEKQEKLIEVNNKLSSLQRRIFFH